jgi:hypothetical protein
MRYSWLQVKTRGYMHGQYLLTVHVSERRFGCRPCIFMYVMLLCGKVLFFSMIDAPVKKRLRKTVGIVQLVSTILYEDTRTTRTRQGEGIRAYHEYQCTRKP